MRKILTIIACVFTLISQAKVYKGAEIYSNESYLYGKFEMKIKAAKGSGQLSTFFLYRNNSEQNTTLWEEIDIEIFGRNTSEFQSNVIIEQQEGTKLMTEEHHTMDFDLSEDFHLFTVEWTPDSICWYIDSVLLRTEKEYALNCINPMSIRFNHWAANISSWVGTFDTSVLPSYQYVDYLSYYSYDSTATHPDSVYRFDWKDDFTTFNSSRWSKANWTFGENLCDFDPANVYIEDSVLVLKLHDTTPPDTTTNDSTDITTSIYTTEKSEGVLLFPNPFRGAPQIINDTGKTIIYKVINLQGICIFESSNTDEVTSYLENIPYGNYILISESPNDKAIYQLISKY